jgi:hypothetical protein
MLGVSISCPLFSGKSGLSRAGRRVALGLGKLKPGSALGKVAAGRITVGMIEAGIQPHRKSDRARSRAGRKRTGNALPRQAQAAVKEGRALIKEAKGLGR